MGLRKFFITSFNTFLCNYRVNLDNLVDKVKESSSDKIDKAINELRKIDIGKAEQILKNIHTKVQKDEKTNILQIWKL